MLPNHFFIEITIITIVTIILYIPKVHNQYKLGESRQVDASAGPLNH